jgi:quercetin dioxygenase-like cupin family protein
MRRSARPRAVGYDAGDLSTGAAAAQSSLTASSSIVEHTFEPGALVPPHLHHLEDEYSIVLDGSIGFRSDDQEVVLEPGGYIIKPRGQVHAMWNAGSTRARMIEVITPAGFERFFHEVRRYDRCRSARFRRRRGTGRSLRAAVQPARLAARRHRPLRPDPAARLIRPEEPVRFSG